MNAPTDNDLHMLAAQVGEYLSRSRRRLVTAESCTGGWIGKIATDIAGSSAWFLGGAIVYSNELKQRSLGVCSTTLEAHGAVSEATVLEMARGALHRLGGEIAVAVSGVAGPSGGSIEKPVGTIWFAWANSAENVVAELKTFSGNREEIRRFTVAHALKRILKL